MDNSNIKIKNLIELNTDKIESDKIIISSPWSIKANMNTGRESLAGCGISSSVLSFGGGINMFPQSSTEEYNGNVWFNKVNMNAAMLSLAGCGTSSSALSFGGINGNETDTELYNGNIWTTKTNMNIGRYSLAGCGTSSSALSFGGYNVDNKSGTVATTELYNGSVWTNKANINRCRYSLAGCGNSNSALAFGGYSSSGTTEEYNGNIWSNKSNMNTARADLAGCGISSSALSFGGDGNFNDYYASVPTTEEYNGIVWSNKVSMNITRKNLAGCGTTSSALSFAGRNGNNCLATTEEYNGNENKIKIDIEKDLNKNIVLGNTKDTWIMQSNLINPRSGLNLIGNKDGALASGGISHNILLEKDKTKFYDYQYYTESFDGNSWSSESNMNIKRCNHSGCGNYDNAIVTLGMEVVNEAFTDSNYLTNTELYDGSVWSSGQDCIYKSYRSSACGEKDSSLVVGSSDSISSYSGVYYLNGNAWTQCNKRNKNNYNSGISGVHNSALSYGGTELTSKISDNSSEYYNGETWAMTESIPVDVDNCNGTGKLSNSVLCRSKTNTCIYNGSTWKSTSYGISYLSEKSSVGNTLSGLSISGLSSANTCLLQSYVEKFIGSKSNKILNAKIKIKGSPLYSYNDIKLDLNMHFSHNKIWKLKNQINNDRQCYIGVGDKDCAVICGGKVSGIISDSVEINSNQIWNTAYSKLNLAKHNSSIFGSVNSFISTAGNTADSSYTDYSEENKGSYFTSIQNLPLKTYSSSGCGVVNSGINICGFSPINSTPGDDYLDKMISYNGSSWSQESNTLIKSMEQNAIGKFNSFIIIGGLNNKIARDGEYSYLRLSSHCYKFDGDSLSTVSDCNIAKSCSSSSGTLNNLINYCGETIVSESFNGSIWKIENCTNNSRKLGCSYGSPLAISGCVDRKDYSTEAYEDVDNINSFLDTLTTPVIKAKKFNWESTTATNIAKYGANATGTVNSCLSFAGINTSALSNTEIFDGESWINKQGLTTCGKYYSGAVGVSNASLIYSGMKHVDAYNNLTEFFNGSAWSNKNALSKNAANVASCGTINNALNIGGFTTNGDDSFSIFDGSEWKLNTAMSESSAFNTAVGSFNSCIVIGGKRGNSNYCEKTELFNGVQWSTGKDISVGRNNHASSGTSQNTIITNGKTSETDSTAYSEKYNGILWSFIQNSSLHKSSTSLSGNTNLSINIGGYMDDAINTCEKYKESDNDVIIDIISSFTWTNKSSMNTARSYLAGSGTSSNALAFGGLNSNNSNLSITEEHNGSIWSNKSNMNTARYGLAGCGTSSSALSFGGNRGPYLDTTEEYNGSVWTNKANMNTVRRHLAGCGISSSALSFGGYDSNRTNNTEEYNGSVWTNKANMNTTRDSLAGCGISSSALSFGGYDGSTRLATTEEYNGSVWTNKANMNTARLYCSGCGISSSALSFGGTNSSGKLDTTEEYNGSVWTNKSSMNTARSGLAGCGTSSSALSFGGNGGDATTEEYSGGSNDYYIPSLNEEFTLENKLEYWKTVNDSHPNPRRSFGLFGAENNAFMTMGYFEDKDKVTNVSEKFNGKEWFVSFNNNLNKDSVGSSGVAEAGLTFGGTHSSSASNTTEKYTSSNSSAGPTLTIARALGAGCGVSNNTLFIGGQNAENDNITIHKVVEAFDGSVWRNHSEMNVQKTDLGSCGNSNSAIEFGGAESPTSNSNYTNIYNSTCWLAKSNMPIAKKLMGGTGRTNKALSSGGYSANPTSSVEEFNGETWRICKNINFGMDFQQSCGYALAVSPIGTKYNSIATEVFKQQYYPEFNSDKLKSISNIVEPYWVVKSDMNNSTAGDAGCGNSSSALSFGGYNGITIIFNTELYNNVYWSNKTNLNNNVMLHAGVGVSSSALVIGGYNMNTDSPIPYTSEYNGNIWLNKSNLNNSRSGTSGCGTSGDALIFGGKTEGGKEIGASTETYNGSIWTNQADMNITKYELAGCGASNSALSIGGTNPLLISGVSEEITAINNVEEYDGLKWISKNNINTSRSGFVACGTINNSFVFNGYGRINRRTNEIYTIDTSESYNGVAWIYRSSNNIPRRYSAGCGTSGNALGYGGQSNNIITKMTEQYYSATDIYLDSDSIILSSDYTLPNLKLKTIYNPSENIRIPNWHIKPNMNSARNNLAGCGNSSSALAFGGYNNNSYLATTEEYKNNVWVNKSDMNTARHELAGCGTSSNALAFGGANSNSLFDITEEYSEKDIYDYVVNDSWTNKANMNTARADLAGCGISSSALSFGGFDNKSGTVATTELYNGSAWTNKASMNTARYGLAGCGISSSALSFGGKNNTDLATTEEYNGSVWTNKSSMNTAKVYLAGCGTSGSALSFGGTNGPCLATTEEYNGSVWTNKADMNTARYELAGCGISSSALSFGGYDVHSKVATTEEYNGSVWTNKANMNSDICRLAGCGTTSSALAFGGYNGGNLANTEEFIGLKKIKIGRGLVWSNKSNMNTARGRLAGCGISSSALSFGGYDGHSRVANSEEYNGSVWSNKANMNSDICGLSGCGHGSIALAFGGTNQNSIEAVATTESYNGTVWTFKANMNTARKYLAGCGNVFNALAIAGNNNGQLATTELYNGVIWSNKANINNARYNLAGCGTSSSALAFGGENNKSIFESSTEEYN